MKSRDEIQFAHDVLSAICDGEVKINLRKADKLALAAARDVFCWILSHPENESFQDNLNALTKMIADNGYHIGKGPVIADAHKPENN